MIVGVPREVKNNENRVAMTPAGVHALRSRGHEVLIESGAGAQSGLSDEEYRAQGARLVQGPGEVWAGADMVVKIKEPQPAEFPLMRPKQILFTYLHLAAEPAVTRALLDQRVTGIAYETVRTADGRLPLLQPMSEVAGRMAVQVGAHYLERPFGGAGVLLGGVPGVRPGRVVILGAGSVGGNAARMAVGLGAEVIVLLRSKRRMVELEAELSGRFHSLSANEYNIREAVIGADLVVGAVLVPGGRAPTLVPEAWVKAMRRGSVIVDVAVDQGGCVETTRPTSHSDPVYEVHGVIHYAVTNMPGAVPRTSTFALTDETLPYVLRLADEGPEKALRENPDLAEGLNTFGGRLTCAPVAKALDLPYVGWQEALGASV